MNKSTGKKSFFDEISLVGESQDISEAKKKDGEESIDEGQGRERLYWKSRSDFSKDNSLAALKHNEFPEHLSLSKRVGESLFKGGESAKDFTPSRRDFLKYMGFSTAAVAAAACESPVVKSIPYVVKPEEVTPGKADFYATTLSDGYDVCGVLVKCREGRPIRVLPNSMYPEHPNARVQAKILSLYDTDRLAKPIRKNGNTLSWETVNQMLSEKLVSTADKKKIVLLTSTLISPSLRNIVKKFCQRYKVSHVEYEALSGHVIAEAVHDFYGVKGIPTYQLSKSECLVSVGADFLNDWFGASLERGYAEARNPLRKSKMMRHYQLESNMTLSGANADYRYALSPSKQLLFLKSLYRKIKGQSLESDFMKSEVSKLSNELLRAGSKGVVLCGLMNLDAQKITLAINEEIQSKIQNLDCLSFVRTAPSQTLSNLLGEIKAGKVRGLITYQVNPVYTFAKGNDLGRAVSEKLDFSVGFGLKQDETVSLMDYQLPVHHPMESWGDVHPKTGLYALSQPLIQPLFDTRQFEQVLLSLMDKKSSYYDYLKEFWRENILQGTSWNQALHDGVLVNSSEREMITPNQARDINLSFADNDIKREGMELTLYTKVGIGNGLDTANNPWLQELPDPITRMSWDNYLTISEFDAQRYGIKNWHTSNGALDGDVVDITVGNKTLNKVPVLIQPGQARGSLGLAIGYGRSKSGKCGNGIGVNAYTFLNGDALSLSGVKIKKVDATHHFASIQLHHTIMGRDIVRETGIKEYLTKPKSQWNPEVELETHHGKTLVKKIDLWESQDRTIGHHFKLAVDLNSCTGCGACVVACHAENNVPVVGKEEVRRGRDMHWLRIDRYYSSDMTKEKAAEDNLGAREANMAMEEASENPEVVFQPVMCQHCNHAPCETVCPVAATSHGKQGQNQMIYNRCVGTRYCANNCPYKVRRFNWFNYASNDRFDYYMNNDLGRMALNPDVVVRSRGVMEKCSLCIQTTQAAILNAKIEKRNLDHNEIQPACSVACSTGSLELGDVNDAKSPVLAKEKGDRTYYLLEALGVKPNVFYQLKLRNKDYPTT